MAAGTAVAEQLPRLKPPTWARRPRRPEVILIPGRPGARGSGRGLYAPKLGHSAQTRESLSVAPKTTRDQSQERKPDRQAVVSGAAGRRANIGSGSCCVERRSDRILILGKIRMTPCTNSVRSDAGGAAESPTRDARNRHPSGNGTSPRKLTLIGKTWTFGVTAGAPPLTGPPGSPTPNQLCRFEVRSEASFSVSGRHRSHCRNVFPPGRLVGSPLSCPPRIVTSCEAVSPASAPGGCLPHP